MRSSTVLVLVAACLALTQGAIAATPPASAPTPAATKAPAKPAAESPETAAKRAACEQTWRAQTKHTGKHKAFIAACVAKG